MPRFSQKPAQINDTVPSETETINCKLQEARETIARLEGIQSAMPDPYYVRDMDYNIVLWPQAIAKLTGYNSVEAKRMKCYEIFKACVCPPGNNCPTQHSITVKKFLKDVAVDVYTKDGETVQALVSNAGIYDDGGNPTGAVEIVKNNTLVHATMDSIKETITKINEVSGTLNTAMEKVKNFSLQVNENSSESLAGIKKGVETGSSVKGKASESGSYAGSVQKNMNSINESMRFSVDKISALKTKSELIGSFINVIQDISSKTNLLAINASIEAAHAGEAGRGFKVVADGIRELSKNSQESALSIQAVIQEINGLIKEATASLNVTEKDIEFGTNTISGLLTFVSEIAASINELMNMMNIMESAAETTSEMIGEQNKYITEVSNVGYELSEIAKKLSDEVFKVIQHVDMG